MDKISRKFIYFILILSLALPVSVIFEAISLNEVYAAKKERKKPMGEPIAALRVGESRI